MSQSPIYLDINNNKSVITALKAGEEKVFDVVYRHYFRCTLMEELTLKTLLFTIVKNKALNRLSHFEIKRKVHQEIVDKYDSEFNNPDFYLSDELFRLYEEALKKLPKEYLEAYEMNRNQHLTHKEIAEKLNVSPQTINYRIGQALKLLRVALKDYLPLFILIFGPNFFEQS